MLVMFSLTTWGIHIEKRVSDKQIISFLREAEAVVLLGNSAAGVLFQTPHFIPDAMPAGWQVCPFQPPIVLFSVRLLTRS